MIHEQSKEMSNREGHTCSIDLVAFPQKHCKNSLLLLEKAATRRIKVNKQTKASTIIRFFDLLQLSQLKDIR